MKPWKQALKEGFAIEDEAWEILDGEEARAITALLLDLVAALADQAARLAEQRVDRHAEQPREQLQRLGIGHGLPVFPARDRLPGHKDLFRQRILRKAVFGSEFQ